MVLKNWVFSRLGILFMVLVSHSLYSCWSLNDEGLALLRIRESVLSDPFGALKNWRSIDDHCSWFGVECSDGKVVILNLKDLCLEGTLAPELRSLIHIKSINLRNNSFNGIVPEGFGELKELEVLDLGYNNLSGPLPHDLGINLSLAILLLDNNELLGGFSPEIYELQILSESQVDENRLSNAAKRKPSCKNKGSITRNGVQNDDAIHRRLLQEAVTPPPPIEPTRVPFMDPYVNISSKSTSLSPSPSSQSPLTPASVAPPASRNNTPSTPNVTKSPPPSPVPSAPSPQNHNISSAIFGGAIGGAIFVLIIIVGIYLCRSNKVATVKPWATGLSGQLQKAFVTGVPKLKRSELEAACEDFSNVIGSSPIGMVYKGTLSSGAEIVVASVVEISATSKDWSKNLEVHFRKKIDTLSKVNHKNFVNLIGFCEEEAPFTRMLVFEYAPNGTLFEHIHIRESEHLDWGMRLRIAMGMAYCLEHMHQLNPPIAHNYLNSSAVSLTEDYAAKLSDLSFWNEIAPSGTGSQKLSNIPSASRESNVYNFGVLLFEMMTGRLPYVVDNGPPEDWASDYLSGDQPLKQMVDPTLNSFDKEQLREIDELIKSCVHPDPRQRPETRDIAARLRDITGLSPDGAIPKLSPLWWAELEILSTEAI
ncbi:hypothetical protein LWI28_011676 [Acer negundo]|uniref:Protein kinase domain-containing protein n=1 Tax=Acer negundo TaxID=4023 RepID=A0AAD5ICE9_ACENE|nr:hypothetical protein LWI28_011676 [Acer negundo]KAK4836605.1 hypothetical protein QYF36_025306 [Acer negundo]